MWPKGEQKLLYIKVCEWVNTEDDFLKKEAVSCFLQKIRKVKSWIKAKERKSVQETKLRNKKICMEIPRILNNIMEEIS